MGLVGLVGRVGQVSLASFRPVGERLAHQPYPTHLPNPTHLPYLSYSHFVYTVGVTDIPGLRMCSGS